MHHLENKTAMNYLDIVFNILTSTFVVGIATYLIQKRIDRRFNRIEEFQRTLIIIRKERYNTLLKTLQEIWEKIIETEYYIRHDIPEQYKNAQQTSQAILTFDSTPLKNAFIFIEKRSILLNDNLSKMTSDLFINHLQSTYNGFIAILNQVPTGQVTINNVNNYIPNALGTKYNRDLKLLKKEFEKQAREILYDDNNKSGA